MVESDVDIKAESKLLKAKIPINKVVCKKEFKKAAAAHYYGCGGKTGNNYQCDKQFLK